MINQSDFEKDYSQLERLIWQEPQLKPPVRGKKPNFESEKEVKELVDTRQIFDVGHYDERVVWLLPRGFLLYRDITFNESSS